MQRARALAAIGLLALGSGTTRADDPAPTQGVAGDLSPRGWHAGVSLRSDYGTHRVRAGIGGRRGPLDVTLVVDPKVFVDTSQNDTDLLVEYLLSPGGGGIMAGWRVTQIAIDRGVQFHHMLLVGMTGGLPPLFGPSIRSRLGVEIEITAIRHGAGIETEVISLASDRHFRDLFSLNLFLRFEYASPL